MIVYGATYSRGSNFMSWSERAQVTDTFLTYAASAHNRAGRATVIGMRARS